MGILANRITAVVKKNPRLRITQSGRKIKVRGKAKNRPGFASFKVRNRVIDSVDPRKWRKGARRLGIRVNPAPKSKQIFVQCERGGKWQSIGVFKDTLMGRQFAKKMARWYKAQHRSVTVRVIAE